MSKYNDDINLAIKLAEQYLNASRVSNEMASIRSAVEAQKLMRRTEELFEQGVNILNKTAKELT